MAWLRTGSVVEINEEGGERLKHSTPNKLKLLLMLALAAAALFLIYQRGRWLEERSAKPEPRGDYQARNAQEITTTYENVDYRQRKSLTSILVLGIDHSETQAEGRTSGGQADFLQLLVVDDSAKQIVRLQIDRDTMTPITVLGVLGNRSGMRTSQISLSHGFGDGREQSCELTVEAVSNLLLGVPVDYYLALNLDGISVLNDMAGGVTVTLTDDFSSLDASMTQGKTLTLQGQQAEFYVRSRRNIGIGTNEARMERQERYVNQLLVQIDELQQKEQDYAGKLYDALTPYLTTNLSRGRLINLAWTARDYTRLNPMQLEGEHRVGSDGFTQFYADDHALMETVLELFYEKMK